jgi:hypothetical protein
MRSPKRKSPGRLENLVPYQFRPGESGNPGGRPKGLMAFVRERVGDNGERLVVALEAIAYGTADDQKAVFGLTRGLRVSPRDRLTAIAELFDRGWGRPAQTIDLQPKEEPQPIYSFNFPCPDLGNRPAPALTPNAPETEGARPELT